jgi:AcrR family transcriptional regulator
MASGVDREPSDAATSGEEALAGKRQQNAIRNRNAILEAAREVFCELGYGAATVRDIIRRTDLATGTFYNYFPDKQAVLRVLVEDFHRELRRRVHEARASASTFEEMLRSAFGACFRFFAEDEMILGLLMRNAGEIFELTSATALEPAIEELALDLAAKAREGVGPSIESPYLAPAMVAVATELAFRIVKQDPTDVEGATAFATALFLGGVERLSGSGS